MDSSATSLFKWTKEISNLESKKIVANQLASKVQNGFSIGVGSGSTSYVTLLAIADRVHKEKLNCKFLPTSEEILHICLCLGLQIADLRNTVPDMCFDGADEILPSGALIKGRGGAFTKEKIIFESARKKFIVADKTKFVSKICEKFPLPIEVIPMACSLVVRKLSDIGATEVKIRPAVAKDGPVITELGNIILDCKFNEEKENLSSLINSIPGVVENGYFKYNNVEIFSE